MISVTAARKRSCPFSIASVRHVCQGRIPMRRSMIAVVAALVGTLAISVTGCSSKQQTVVVYASEDQVFSEPILRDFERESGVRVKPVFDTEEAKSTGVMNRLLAEKNNPQADVYWANEPVRADVLRQQAISTQFKPVNAAQIPDQFKEPQGFWTGFSARARLLVVN